MMTLYLVFEQIEQGRLTYQTKIKMSANAAAAAPSKLDLDEGDEIALIDAVKALITKSANDVAVAVAEHIGGTEANFARLMTQKAAQLGMKSTLFKNASGLPDDEQVTTARDMVTLALRLQDDFPKHYPLFATRDLHVQRRYLQEPQQAARQLRGHGRPEDRLHPRLGLQPGRLGPARAEARDRRRVRRRPAPRRATAPCARSSTSAWSRPRTSRRACRHLPLVAARPKPAPERKVAEVPSPRARGAPARQAGRAGRCCRRAAAGADVHAAHRGRPRADRAGARRARRPRRPTASRRCWRRPSRSRTSDAAVRRTASAGPLQHARPLRHGDASRRLQHAA